MPRSPLLAIATAGLVVWSLGSCSSRKGGIRNVLLISIDTLRADHVGSYGFPGKTTPALDGLAREGVLFENVVSPIPATFPAHCSMLTGTLPPYHGLHDNLGGRLPDSSITLAELLKEGGLTTGAIVSSFVLDSRFNLRQGFDAYDDRFEKVHKINYLSERKGDETARRASAWLEAHAREPFFLFVHFYDPHDGYEPPEPFASAFAGDPYSGEVAFADHCAGQVIDTLKRLGLLDSTLVVVTSDHGEMLGEHGELTHQFFVYQSALRVPLIFRVPGHLAPRRVGQLVGLADIVPTICGVLGIHVPQVVQGEDFSAWLQGGSPPIRRRELYAESFTPARYYGASPLFALVTEDWKYIETTRPELYDLQKDPGETVNLLEAQRPRAEAFRSELKRLLEVQAPKTESVALDQESRERLASLGYLGRSHGDVGFELGANREDPKDLIGFYRSDQRLSELIEHGSYDEARILSDKMLRERPGFVDGHVQRAEIAAAQGDSAGAIAHYSKAMELDPKSERARLGLARALNNQRRFGEAARLLEGTPPSADAEMQLGLALASQGRLDQSLEHYRKALALDPNSAEAHAYLGSALASKGQLDEAIDHLRTALRTRPDVAQVHQWLGVALKQRGRTEEAGQHFREALRIAPGLAEPHLHLGLLFKQQGRLDEAGQEYRRALALDPRLAAAHNSLGSLLGSQGRLPDAIRQFREAIRIDPGFGDAHNNLGLALRMTGDRDEALRHFEAALRLRADWPVPMNEIAWILATHPDDRIRNPSEALRLAQRAAELTPRQPVILDTLAAAYAASGDFDRAAATAQEATALAASGGPAGLAAEIGKRLELYRQKKPFRETGRRATVGLS
jgi:tetratricopeptide (TPR) repeat protein